MALTLPPRSLWIFLKASWSHTESLRKMPASISSFFLRSAKLKRNSLMGDSLARACQSIKCVRGVYCGYFKDSAKDIFWLELRATSATLSPELCHKFDSKASGPSERSSVAALAYHLSKA